MTMRPKLLDLFCCQGGASTGYQRAGFDVYGVDIEPQDNYPFAFHQGDALSVLRALLAGHPLRVRHLDRTVEWLLLEDFAAIHASPPCQAFSTITPDPTAHPELIAPTRVLLAQTGLPYVIENVEGAKRELVDPVLLCGSSFGLRVRRHRWFESNTWLTSIPCDHEHQGTPVGVYGDHGDLTPVTRPDGTSRGAKARDTADARHAMGMDWADWHGLAEAIPPAYTEWIGHQLLEHLEHADRAARRSVTA